MKKTSPFIQENLKKNTIQYLVDTYLPLIGLNKMPIPPNMAKYVAELSWAWAGYLSARTIGTTRVENR